MIMQINLPAGVLRIAIVAIAFAALYSRAAVAQSLLPPTIEACTKVVSEHERLQCFDRESAALMSHHEAAARPAAAPALTPEQKLGLSPVQVHRLEKDQGVKSTEIK